MFTYDTELEHTFSNCYSDKKIPYFEWFDSEVKVELCVSMR